MNIANDCEFEASDSDSIWLELSFEGRAHSFALPSDETRAVAVGSFLRADVRIDRPGVAPVQFHIERENDQLWIVPAYSSNELRVDAVRVRGPRRIDGRALIEFCGLRIRATVLEPHLMPQRTSSVRRRQTLSEAPQGSGKVFEERPLGAVESAPLASTPSDDELPTIAFQRFVTPSAPVQEQPTTQLPVFSKSAETQPQCNVAIQPFRIIGLGEARESKGTQSPKSGPIPTEPAQVDETVAASTLSMTADTIETRPFWLEEPESEHTAHPNHFVQAQRPQQTQETLRFVPMRKPQAPFAPAPQEAIPNTTAFDVPTANSGRLRFIGWIAQLGLLSKRRPVLVWLVATATAFVLSATITWFAAH